jgi:pimeloyl-ACP methyl ester carboxylesterase
MVDGLSVSGHCTGTRVAGEPVVILQAGNGGGEDALRGIEDHLSGRAQVCAFGRPGAGGNPAPADLPRSVDAIVTEVHDVLAAAGIEPPYFPIGASAGGAISFMFAQAFPDQVAGFVDINGNPPIETWSAAAAEAGLAHHFVDDAMADFSGQNPEGIDFRSNESMLTEPFPPDMPYAVIYDECGDGPDCFAAFEGAVFEALAEVGEGGRFVWAIGAGHEAALTEPELVHATIDEVWTEAID